ncbi:MAG: hypothetical protein QM535_13310 [Limnohabitans sp.]|nr:hypothetical protein [Limnohabitans sp.]MDI9311188.1 hypothetical protein [Limnohabitans sp.]
MNPTNFNNKVFVLLHNTANGTTNEETKFYYKQTDDLVTADFYGGTVKYGKIIAIHKGDNLEMVYQMLTSTNELKSGKAIANIVFNENEKIELHLNWEWLTTSENKGNSIYKEI